MHNASLKIQFEANVEDVTFDLSMFVIELLLCASNRAITTKINLRDDVKLNLLEHETEKVRQCTFMSLEFILTHAYFNLDA